MADDERFPVTALWVLNAAVLVTNAAILTALDVGRSVLVLMAVVTAFLALGSAIVARSGRHRPTDPIP